MKILEVLPERDKQSLSGPFTYLYDGKAPIGETFRVMVPFGHQKIMGFVLSLREDPRPLEEIQKDYDRPLRFIDRVIDVEPLLDKEAMDMALEVSRYYLSPLISVLQAMLPKSLSPRSSSLKGPKIAYEKWLELVDPSEEGLTDKQIELSRMLVRLGTFPCREAPSKTAMENLIKIGRARVVLREKERLCIPTAEREEAHEMTPVQRNAFEEIIASDKDVILLEGVTGSGKTEVYLRLSEVVLKEGKNVLMLVPEINLTPVMVDYFSRRFGEKIAILHSGLTPAQKYDEYRRIKNGGARIVVGARSAVFAPLSDIGLIVIDEEHTESYKADKLPFYHAREVAIIRGRRSACKVILGSATPSLETRARADRGVYGYSYMGQRVNEQNLPLTKIIDMREKSERGSEKHIFSKELIEKLREKLEKKEQAILLLNRRGYSSYIACANCGFVYECPECHTPLTYHKEDRLLKCHRCGFVRRVESLCPECGQPKMHRIGYGTERVMKEIGELFPQARAVRMDSDSAKNPKSVYEILSSFREHKYDIMVGTQMIAKGHDFPLVTLVGDVLADIGLNLPTYRAAERSFGLIAQSVGRSGRASKMGEAYIQTYSPNHYAVVYGAKQDYQGFYHQEMANRKAFQYPPYVYLILLTFQGKNEERTTQTAMDMKLALDQKGFETTTVIGPRVPFFSKLGDVYRREVLIKFKKDEGLTDYLSKTVPLLSGKGGVDIQIERDPIDC